MVGSNAQQQGPGQQGDKEFRRNVCTQTGKSRSCALDKRLSKPCPQGAECKLADLGDLHQALVAPWSGGWGLNGLAWGPGRAFSHVKGRLAMAPWVSPPVGVRSHADCASRRSTDPQACHGSEGARCPVSPILPSIAGPASLDSRGKEGNTIH